MKFRKYSMAIFAAAGMLVLIMDSKTAIAGAGEGVELCIRTLIPSLFPFFILSNILTNTMLGSPLKILRPLGKLCRIPGGCESLLAVGFLGGYPVGAQNIALACRRGQIQRSTAKRMLSFCNNAGPAFLFGIIGPMFSGISSAWILWLIHIFSALLVSFMIPSENNQPAKTVQTGQISISQALEQSIKVMAMVSGWVILFRMMLQFLNRWILWAFPVPLQVLISGFLELSNGCVMLSQIECEGLRFVIASLLLSFGGVCITMQTFSVCKGCDLSLYFPGKLLQGLLSFLLASLIQKFLFTDSNFYFPPVLSITAVVGCVVCFLLLHKTKKISSIPAGVGV